MFKPKNYNLRNYANRIKGTDTFTGFDPEKVEAAGIKVIMPNSGVAHAKADGAGSLVVPEGTPVRAHQQGFA